MIRDTFIELMDYYPVARSEPFKSHDFARFIRHDVPKPFKDFRVREYGFRWGSSAGNGQWADAPWIAAFDPVITETAQNGFYPCYLFTKSMDAVYLSLNQGTEELRKEFKPYGGRRAVRDVLAKNAQVFRHRLRGRFKDPFDLLAIDLQHEKSQSRMAFYESAHAFGKIYRRDSMPPEEELASDLQKMLNFYRELALWGGGGEFDSLTDEEMITDRETMKEKGAARYHLRMDRNPKLSKEAKKIHGTLCQICGFNFEEIYGSLGKGYIEAHHLTPLHQLEEGTHLSPREDFRAVCANCHRMIHRKDAPSEFIAFKALFDSLNS